ncbi:MAG: DegV family protein [Lachnospiraceae bacterium]|nr:DegV family protein [Lachnospiraceae bacterium]
MQNFIIATSSTSDLTREYLEEHKLPFIGYTYTVNDKLYEDDCRESSRQAVYDGMRKGDRLKTSMINEYTYREFFKSLMDQGKDVLFLDMSQKMSASYANSVAAAESIKEEYPSNRLYIMDTYCISGGLGLLVKNIVKMAENGASFEEVIEWGEKNKLKIAHRFTVDDLNYLKAGGRVSNAAALVGTILDVKPVLYVPDGGTLDVTKKVRGRRSALNTIIKSVLNDLGRIDAKGAEIDILHADCRNDAETVKNAILEAHPEVGEINITSLGVTIGAHCGPGLLTVFYMCDERTPL